MSGAPQVATERGTAGPLRTRAYDVSIGRQFMTAEAVHLVAREPERTVSDTSPHTAPDWQRRCRNNAARKSESERGCQVILTPPQEVENTRHLLAVTCQRCAHHGGE